MEKIRSDECKVKGKIQREKDENIDKNGELGYQEKQKTRLDNYSIESTLLSHNLYDWSEIEREDKGDGRLGTGDRGGGSVCAVDAGTAFSDSGEREIGGVREYEHQRSLYSGSRRHLYCSSHPLPYRSWSSHLHPLR